MTGSHFPFIGFLPISLSSIQESNIIIGKRGFVQNVEEDITGWVAQPDSRGTLDVLWNSLFTVFLCTWTVLCLNLPSAEDPRWRIVWRKLRWMFLALMGPEFLLCFAIGQLASARRSVAAFHASGYTQWTLHHAFFADMGGFVLQPHDSQSFPINAKQLHYLVTKGYVSMPSVSTKGIKDRTKADGFTKFVTIVQTTWFLLQVLGRAIQHLAIATLELTAVAVVVCTLATFYCWLRKPLDVEEPVVLITSASSADILVNGGDAAAAPYKQTPLDFVDDLGPSWSVHVMARFGFRTGPRRRPLRRLGNCRIPKLDRLTTVILFTLTHIYGSIHMIGWNFSFPSQTERLLWRISSSTIFITTFLFWAIDRGEAWRHDGKYKEWTNRLLRRHKQTNEKRKAERGFHAPTWVLAVNVLIATCYSFARMYLFFEGFIGLRKLPASAFVCVQWNNILPHIT
jgi:hypothetical protein